MKNTWLKLEPRFQWHWRQAGGVFIGLRVFFPCTVLDDDNHAFTWTCVSVSIGLIAATVSLDVLTNRRFDEAQYK